MWPELVHNAANGREEVVDLNSRTIASAAIFTAFVFAVTFSIAVTTSTGGYFDVGEIMVYITALVMGPYVGAFAGGVGSMLSDALLAPQFAPGTLVIKGAEGFIVGYIARKQPYQLSEGGRRQVAILVSVAVGVIVVVVGFLSFPDVTLTLGQLGFTPVASSQTVGVSTAAWVVLGVFAFGATLLLSRRVGGKFAWTTLAIVLGGAEMVAGYFLYETVVLQLGLASPTAEIPVNALQAILGLMVAPSVANRVRTVFIARAPRL